MSGPDYEKKNRELQRNFSYPGGFFDDFFENLAEASCYLDDDVKSVKTSFLTCLFNVN